MVQAVDNVIGGTERVREVAPRLDLEIVDKRIPRQIVRDVLTRQCQLYFTSSGITLR